MSRTGPRSQQLAGRIGEIRLQLPCALAYRWVLLKAVSNSCRMVARGKPCLQTDREEFVANVVSAVGEAFNNIVIHGCGEHERGLIRVLIEPTNDRIRVTMEDFGQAFDPLSAPPPDLSKLPESGIGIFMMTSFLDSVRYRAGSPNVTEMIKIFRR